MNILNKFRNWLAALLVARPRLYPPGGRSSRDPRESLSNTANFLMASRSPIDFELLRKLKQLWLFHPEFSQSIANIVALANTGHQIVIEASSDAVAERALNRLNERAAMIYKHGAGIDGLVNAELTQLAWSGALSSEDVVNLPARRVEQVVLVPVEDIRFKYNREAEQWEPYQRVMSVGVPDGLIPLHPITYHYSAIETLEDSPYAKPPATAAVGPITDMQGEVIDNLKYIVRKFSILGLVTAMIRRLPQKPNETEHEYNARSADFLQKVKESLSGNFNQGLLVSFDNIKFGSENVTASGTGFYDIYRTISETVMSGLRQQPAFFGRTDSTTETYADVVYQLLLSQAANFQRIVKRRREKTYMLDLRLAGINVKSLSLQFNKAFSRNRLADAQADQVESNIIVEHARAGIISADQAAQKLGYEKAFNPAALEMSENDSNQQLNRQFSLRFNRKFQKYRILRPKIEVSEVFSTHGLASENLVAFKKKESA